MPPSSLQPELRVLLAARWLTPDQRDWLRACQVSLQQTSSRWSIVVPDDVPFDVPGLEWHSVPHDGREFSLWRAIRPLVASGQYDLVHALDYAAAGHAGLACMGLETPFVVSLSEHLAETRFTGLVGSLERWLLGRALAKASAITTESNAAIERLLQVFPNLRAPEYRTLTIPANIDTASYRDRAVVTGDTLRHELALPEETTLLGYFGPISPDGGLDVLLDALSRLVVYNAIPPFHLVVFTNEDAEDEINSRSLGYHVTQRQPLAEYATILEQLDLVVIPAFEPRASRLVKECLCAGVPLLAPVCHALRDVVHDTPARLVPPQVVSSLETALRQALLEPWFEEAAAFALIACERFDIRESVAQLVELYRCVATNTDAPPVWVLAAGG
jgi:glycosyltransferase involved in cell wall biosynthesis